MMTTQRFLDAVEVLSRGALATWFIVVAACFFNLMSACATTRASDKCVAYDATHILCPTDRVEALLRERCSADAGVVDAGISVDAGVLK